jgi:hypothetical protein
MRPPIFAEVIPHSRHGVEKGGAVKPASLSLGIPTTERAGFIIPTSHHLRRIKALKRTDLERRRGLNA